MPDVTLKTFRFLSLRYQYNEGSPKQKKLASQINVQCGCPKEQGRATGAVRMRFVMEAPDSDYLSITGEAVAYFAFPEGSGPVTTELVAEKCWPLAYEEFRRRFAQLTGALGATKEIKLKPFDSLPADAIPK